MGALAHHIETEGVATAQISLIREHTEQIRPPRALWVPFELGRPFGPPNHPEFQTDVLRTVLDLFKKEAGPALENYPRESPEPAADADEWACALPLPPLQEGVTAAEQATQMVLAEMAQLRPWYYEARQRTGRTAFNSSGLELEHADEMAAFLAEFSTGGAVSPPDGVPEPMPAAVRVVVDDLKTFYLEAAAAQPGQMAPGSANLNGWFFHETKLGSVLYDIRDRLVAEVAEGQRPVNVIPGVYTKRPE